MDVQKIGKSLVISLVAALLCSSYSTASDDYAVRYITFPKGANLGYLDSPDETKRFFHRAEGVVVVPMGTPVRLQFFEEDSKDLSALDGLGPGDLQIIDFSQYKVSDADLVHIKGLTSLQSLYLDGAEITDKGLSNLENFTELRALILTYTGITDAGLKQIARLETLETLDLYGTKISDEGLAYLKNLTSLKELKLSGPGITDAGLAYFADLGRLESLSLGGTAITDASLSLISTFSSLRTLDLVGTRISDEGLAHLSTLTNLETLDLGYTDISDEGLAHIAHLSSLKTLRLHETKVTDAGLTKLKALTSLEYLTLSGLDIDGSGLSELADLQSLRYLNLSDTKVEDAALAYIKNLKSLKHLYLDGTRVSKEGYAGLRGSMQDYSGPPDPELGQIITLLKWISGILEFVPLAICLLIMPRLNRFLLGSKHRLRSMLKFTILGCWGWLGIGMIIAFAYLSREIGEVSPFFSLDLVFYAPVDILFDSVTSSGFLNLAILLMMCVLNGIALSLQHDVEGAPTRSIESLSRTVIARALVGVVFLTTVNVVAGGVLAFVRDQILCLYAAGAFGLGFALTVGLYNSLTHSWISLRIGKSVAPLLQAEEGSPA